MTSEHIPLAHRMRPRTLAEVLGQEHITGPRGFISTVLRLKRPRSMILWGPPGSGKTTLAELIQRETECPFEAFSAVSSGVKDLRNVIETAKKRLREVGKPTILFVDEIHRFNKAQQDAFLPYVEKGIIVLLGATTENPSFEIIPPLLSRCRVLKLEPLSRDVLERIISLALQDPERGLGGLKLSITKAAKELLTSISNGDARLLLNVLEFAALAAKERGKHEIDEEIVRESVEGMPLYYDKQGEEHYNLISAFIKSMRGSDPQATLYWLYRMLQSGEDRSFILRRIIRFAAEDIGLRDPMALVLAQAAFHGFDVVGSPEGELIIAEAALYMALAPKDNTLYVAEKKVLKKIQETGSIPVPLHLRNPVTGLMKGFGYGRGYIYPHDHPNMPQEYLPHELRDSVFYIPKHERKPEGD